MFLLKYKTRFLCFYSKIDVLTTIVSLENHEFLASPCQFYHFGLELAGRNVI